MGKHESFEAFKPDKDNVRAVQEEQERKTMEVHNTNLFDVTPDGKIDEATGKAINNSPQVHGADEERGERAIKKNKSGDMMGALRGALPDDDEAARKMIEKELERLQKKQAAKKGDNFKKAA